MSVERKAGRFVTSSMHYMSGEPAALNKFIKNLGSDNDVLKIERRGNTFLLLEKAKSKAVGFHTPAIIFIKPVVIREDGWEFWEVGSWKKEELMQFIKKIRKTIKEFKLMKFVEEPIDTVFFPRLFSNLTDLQKRALELAISEGYYSSPRRTDLRKLARIMKISLATYSQHLRRAEEKLVPNLLTYMR